MADETPTAATPARPSFTTRVADRAVDVNIARLVLSLIALPFYVLGFIAGLVLVAARWCWAAAAVGIEDARRTRREIDDGVTDAG